MAQAELPQKKRCTKCGLVRAISEFGPRKERASGVRSSCYECGRKASARWKALHPDKVAAQAQAAKAKPERGRLAQKRYRLAHPDRIAAQNEKRNQSRKDDADKQRERERQQYAKNRDHIRERKMLNRERHRDWFLHLEKQRRDSVPAEVRQARNATNNAKRRATPEGKISNSVRVRIHRELVGKGGKSDRTFALLGYSADDLRHHLERQFLPGMTWRNYGKHGWHIDHILALSSFSFSSTTDPEFRAAWALSNLRPLWAIDNISKGAKRLLLI